MAEGAVVKDQLTAAMIEAGAELTARLDESGLPITTALWLFEPDLNEWRLLFASPDVATRGPRGVYERIQNVIGQLGENASTVPLSIIGLMDADADLVRRLKVAVQAKPGVDRIRLSKDVIDGHFIDDALIYRAA